MKQFTLATALLAASMLGGIPASAQNAKGGSPAEGIWHGGYKQGRNSITLRMTNIAGVGSLDISSRGWEPIGHGNCQYVFQSPGLSVDKVHLNRSFGSPEKCPGNLSFAMKRTGPDSLTLAFKDAMPLAEVELAAGLRPLRDEDRRKEIAGLDILGVETGMKRAEAEKILKDAGYEHDEASARTATSRSGWTLETHYYVGKSEGAEKDADVVAVAYSESKSPKVMVVGRDWKIPESAKLSVLTVKDALQEKYGPSYSNTGDERAYDRQGKTIVGYDERNAKCKPGSLQTIRFQFARKGTVYNGQVNPYCGPLTDMLVGTVRNSGLASYLNVWIADPDEIWDNFWRTWSIDEHAKIDTLYNSVAGATGKAPRL